MAEPVTTIRPQLRLVFQGSIKIETNIEGEIQYEEIKTFIKALDPICTLNGQIIEMLEPCCNKPKGETNVDKNS